MLIKRPNPAADVLRFNGWTAYIPAVGGPVIFFVGLMRVSWKFILMGSIVTAIGVGRVLIQKHALRQLER